jgi:hypothetical protein
MLNAARWTTAKAGTAVVGVGVSLLQGQIQTGPTTTTFPSVPVIGGRGTFDFASRSGAVTLSILTQNLARTVAVVSVPGQVYVQDDNYLGALGGKSWASFADAPYLKEQSGLNGLAGVYALGDPTVALQLLQYVSGPVTSTSAGTESGLTITDYHSTLDLTKPPLSGPSLIDPQTAKTQGLDKVPVDVWIDSSGRARAIQTAFRVQGVRVIADMFIAHFGPAAPTSAPAASTTADGAKLLGKGQFENLFAGATS